MCEPWEAYFKSVKGETDKLMMAEPPIDPESDEWKGLLAAFETAKASTSELLIRDQAWFRSAAFHLADEFLRTSLDWLVSGRELGFAGLRVRLRHRYEDWLMQ